MKGQFVARAAVGAGAATIAALLVRRTLLRLGSTPAEHAGPHPGDDLVPDAHVVATRGVTIAVPRARVWPWICQIGQDRGGFYSYDAIENLMGFDIHSVDHIVPEWQHVRVGDEVGLEPGVRLRVARVEPGRHLVLSGRVPMGRVTIPARFSWAFVLLDGPGGTTRLLSRARYAHERWWSPLCVEPSEMISSVMTGGMLRGIRRRAEGSAASEPDSGGAARGSGEQARSRPVRTTRDKVSANGAAQPATGGQQEEGQQV